MNKSSFMLEIYLCIINAKAFSVFRFLTKSIKFSGNLFKKDDLVMFNFVLY